MRILSKYFSKEFLKLFGLLLIIFLSMYLIVEFIQKIDDFIEANAPNSLLLAFLFYNLPYILVQMIPVATLLSVIVMLCLMEKNNEITAMKACGVSVFKLSQPIICVSILISIAVFLFSELIVPYATERANEIWQVQLHKGKEERFYGKNNIWYRGQESIYWIRHFDSTKKAMEDLTLYFFDNSFHLTKRIDALVGIWNGREWELRDGIIQEALDGDEYDLKKFERLMITLPEKPEAFMRSVKQPAEMSYWQLKRFAERVRLEGYDVTEYLVDMNIKLAYPLINVVMVFIGIPIALGLKRGGTPLAVSLGIGACFLYMVSYGLSRSFGLSGLLPAAFSAWLANFIFFLFGVYAMMRLET